MNAVEAKPEPLAAEGPAKGLPLAQPAAPPAVTVRMEELPLSVQRILARVMPQDKRYVEALLCRLPFLREAVHAIAFVDTVWNTARMAEYRSSNRITGAEMDEYRGKFDRAVREFVAIADHLARHAGLTEMRQRYRNLLRRHGLVGQPANGNGHLEKSGDGEAAPVSVNPVGVSEDSNGVNVALASPERLQRREGA